MGDDKADTTIPRKPRDGTIPRLPMDGKPRHIVSTESVNTEVKDNTNVLSLRGKKRPLLMELSEHFVEVTGIPWLDPQTSAEWAAAKKLWTRPLERILEMVGGNVDAAKLLVTQAVRRLRKNNMTIASPGSLEKTCRAIVGEARTGSFKPELSVDEVVDLVYQRMDE